MDTANFEVTIATSPVCGCEHPRSLHGYRMSSARGMMCREVKSLFCAVALGGGRYSLDFAIEAAFMPGVELSDPEMNRRP